MSTIAIRPYISPKKEDDNMGLQKSKQVLFESTAHKISMWMKQDVGGSGIYRAITGLNEFAPELNLLSEEDKKAKIAEIRKTVVMLEGALASNEIKANDKDFWSKVQRVKPDNLTFWATITITPSNEPIFLDPTEPEDVIKIFSIGAGGFPEIAPSFEVAKTGQKKYKFYLDKFEDTIKETTKVSISEARAKVQLLDIFDNNINKLNYICKSIDANSPQYKKSTPPLVLFGNMHDYIEGKLGGIQQRESGNAANFIKIAALDMETLKLRALVKDASFYGFLTVRSGQIFETGNDTPLGYNLVEVVEFLKNVLHDAILQRLMSKIQKYWNE